MKRGPLWAEFPNRIGIEDDRQRPGKKALNDELHPYFDQGSRREAAGRNCVKDWQRQTDEQNRYRCGNGIDRSAPKRRRTQLLLR